MARQARQQAMRWLPGVLGLMLAACGGTFSGGGGAAPPAGSGGVGAGAGTDQWSELGSGSSSSTGSLESSESVLYAIPDGSGVTVTAPGSSTPLLWAKLSPGDSVGLAWSGQVYSYEHTRSGSNQVELRALGAAGALVAGGEVEPGAEIGLPALAVNGSPRPHVLIIHSASASDVSYTFSSCMSARCDDGPSNPSPQTAALETSMPLDGEHDLVFQAQPTGTIVFTITGQPSEITSASTIPDTSYGSDPFAASDTTSSTVGTTNDPADTPSTTAPAPAENESSDGGEKKKKSSLTKWLIIAGVAGAAWVSYELFIKNKNDPAPSGTLPPTYVQAHCAEMIGTRCGTGGSWEWTNSGCSCTGTTGLARTQEDQHCMQEQARCVNDGGSHRWDNTPCGTCIMPGQSWYSPPVPRYGDVRTTTSNSYGQQCFGAAPSLSHCQSACSSRGLRGPSSLSSWSSNCCCSSSYF